MTGSLHEVTWPCAAGPRQSPQADAQGISPERAASQARRDRDLRCSPRPATSSPATSTQAVSSGDGYANTAHAGVTPYLYPVPGRSLLTASLPSRHRAATAERGDDSGNRRPGHSGDCSTGCCRRRSSTPMTGSWLRTAARKTRPTHSWVPSWWSVLTHWGMAHVQPHTPADPAWLRPASPDLALQGVLAGHQHRLARDQELLLHGQRRLADAQARFGIGMTSNGRLPEHLVAVVTDRDADQRPVRVPGQHRAQGLDDPGEPGHRHAADRGLHPAAAARGRRAGPLPVHLRRSRDGRPGRPADHPDLRRRLGNRPGCCPACR